MFSNGSSSSTSRAMVTPSLVMVGAPNFLSMTTLRPFGPIVTLTVSASLFTPASRPRRAASSNFRILGMTESNSSRVLLLHGCGDACGPAGDPGGAGSGQLGQDIPAGEDEEILALDGDLGASVLGVHHGVAHGDIGRDQFSGVFRTASRSHGENFALLGLLL